MSTDHKSVTPTSNDVQPAVRAAMPFSLLLAVHHDPLMTDIFGEAFTIRLWLDVEAKLAQSQAACGVMTPAEAAAIARAADTVQVDAAVLWESTRTVGYPILPVVKLLSAAVDGQAGGRVHFGATTQDIMDTALAIQLVLAGNRLIDLVMILGDALATRVACDRDVTIAARTHGQQAVPTTLGAKFAVYLAETTRQRERLLHARDAVGVVSLFGAGGTSAALGAQAREVRANLAAALNLRTTDVPWHVARDGIAEFGAACASVSQTCVRFAREVIDLSRTEINELGEPMGYQRGASSTMPQKANPITSEAIVGLGVSASTLTNALFRAMEAGHERSAGEWQIEWQVIPQIAVLTSSAVRLAGQLCSELVINPDAIATNLLADGGLLMSEALMMRLAPLLGRDEAHEIVYLAAHDSRASARPIEDILDELMRREHPAVDWQTPKMPPSQYVGEASLICDSALAGWKEIRG